jgi:CRP-like cAMP-binding protein
VPWKLCRVDWKLKRRFARYRLSKLYGRGGSFMAYTAEDLAPREIAAKDMSDCANRLVAALDPRELARLTPHMRLLELNRDQVLFDVGQDVNHTYLPCRGTMVSLLVVSKDGQEIEVANVGREGAIGGVVSAGFKPAYGRAVVRVPGHALCIPTARLEEAKNQSPAIGDLFSRYADALLAQMMQSAACNALHNVEQRCCRWLLSAHDRANDQTIRLTQEALAQMLGVQRTTVTAVIGVLQDQGLIGTGRGRMDVLDRPGLEKRACECHDAVENHFQRILPEVEVTDA